MDSLEYTAPQYAEAEAKKAYRRAGTALFAFIVATQLAAIFISIVPLLFFPQLINTDWFVLALNFVCIYCVGAPFFFLIFGKTTAIPQEKKKMPTRHLICAAFIAISCIYVFNILTIIIMTGLEAIFDTSFTNRLDETFGNANLWLAILSTVVIAPIMEELIFRKMLCDRLAPHGEWQAIIFSALAFALFHTNLQQILYAFTLGCVFGVIYVRTRNIVYTMILHAIVNFIGSVPGLLLLRSDLVGVLDRFVNMTAENDTVALLEYFLENAHIIIPYLLYCVVLVMVVLTGIILGLINLMKLIRAADGRTMPKKRRFVIMFSGVFTILYVVVAMSLTVYSLFA